MLGERNSEVPVQVTRFQIRTLRSSKNPRRGLNGLLSRSTWMTRLSRLPGFLRRKWVTGICFRESAANLSAVAQAGNSKLLLATLRPPAFKTLTSTAERAGWPRTPSWVRQYPIRVS